MLSSPLGCDFVTSLLVTSSGHILGKHGKPGKLRELKTCQNLRENSGKLVFLWKKSVQNCPQNSDRVQLRFQSPKRYIIKHLNTKLYSIEFLRTEVTSGPSNYHREYSLYGSYLYFGLRDLTSFLSLSTQWSQFCVL